MNFRNEVWASADLCSFDCYGRHDGLERVHQEHAVTMDEMQETFWAQLLNAVSSTTSASPQNLSRELLL